MRFEVFVGRKREFAELRDALADTGEGRGRKIHPSENEL
jgi:hypothetical protein